jgi:hypothetical protein
MLRHVNSISSSSSNSNNTKKEKPPVVPRWGTVTRARRKRKAKDSGCPTDYTADFEIIWQPYPNGDAKREAFEEWWLVKTQAGRHAGQSVPKVAKILQVIDWKLRSNKWARDDGQYVEQFQRFLRRRRFEDEPHGVAPLPIKHFETAALKHYRELTAEEPKP